MENYISISNLHFKRGNREIFSGVDLDIPKGKITAIMGPSGTGKTTLLKLIGAQLQPTQGEIFLDGKNVNSLSRKELFKLRSNMGFLFQSGALFTNFSVFENVAFPLRVHTNLSEEAIHDIVLLKLEAVGLRGARALMPAELSGGMARRVALARAIALDPDLILYDEPFTGQDPISMGVLVKLIKETNQALGTTSVIVSHDVQEVVSIADYVCILSSGKIVAKGTPHEINTSQQAEVDQFMHGKPDGPVPFHYPAVDIAVDLAIQEGDHAQ
jgi:phospholipid/cholesterol/gamma-HCH transport system ATP-binding protein